MLKKDGGDLAEAGAVQFKQMVMSGRNEVATHADVARQNKRDEGGKYGCSGKDTRKQSLRSPY